MSCNFLPHAHFDHFLGVQAASKPRHHEIALGHGLSTDLTPPVLNLTPAADLQLVPSLNSFIDVGVNVRSDHEL